MVKKLYGYAETDESSQPDDNQQTLISPQAMDGEEAKKLQEPTKDELATKLGGAFTCR